MNDKTGDAGDRLLMPAQVAALYKVDPKTASRWAAEGRFPPGAVVRTLGGHIRLRESLVLAQMRASESRS